MPLDSKFTEIHNWLRTPNQHNENPSKKKKSKSSSIQYVPFNRWYLTSKCSWHGYLYWKWGHTGEERKADREKKCLSAALSNTKLTAHLNRIQTITMLTSCFSEGHQFVDEQFNSKLHVTLKSQINVLCTQLNIHHVKVKLKVLTRPIFHTQRFLCDMHVLNNQQSRITTIS
jgi:hypothetical protein